MRDFTPIGVGIALLGVFTPGFALPDNRHAARHQPHVLPRAGAKAWNMTTTDHASTTSVESTAPGFITTTITYIGTEPVKTTITSTISPSGNTPGIVIVQIPASYVTTTVPYSGTVTTTSTASPSGTVPGTVIVKTPHQSTTRRTTSTSSVLRTSTTTPSASTCVIAQPTRRVAAKGNAANQAAFVVPACATKMSFSLFGGAGGGKLQRGKGGLTRGSVSVTPGQAVLAQAGGQGVNTAGGKSGYGNGGDGAYKDGGGGGGGATALYVANNLVSVAAGGGGSDYVVFSVPDSKSYYEDTKYHDGKPGDLGASVYVYTGSNPYSYHTLFGGGAGGTSAAVGKGGQVSGYSNIRTTGNPGNGHNGGRGVVATAPNGNRISSGGGGGGYYGAGSGAAGYVSFSGGLYHVGAAGGGGSNYVAKNVLTPSTGVAPYDAAGSIEVVFS